MYNPTQQQTKESKIKGRCCRQQTDKGQLFLLAEAQKEQNILKGIFTLLNIHGRM